MDSSSTHQTISKVPSATALSEPPLITGAVNLGSYVAVKRILDVLACLALIVALFPFMLLLAALVRFDSVGPVIYRQRRVGRHGGTFVLYKFRTMEVGAPTLPTEEIKRASRSYYTKVGLTLRRYSLDELPQLVNVLRGDMSLIGPRPSLTSQEWLNTRRELCRVQELRPGITGWAQVSGRDELSDTAKVAFDAEYRLSCSLAMDCRIALMTIKAVFTGDGAN